MHPEPGELSPLMGAGRLGQLVLVVREDQIDTAAVDVDRQAENLFDHRRALAVPAGPSVAPGRGPTRLMRLRRLPKHEVGGMALVGGHLDAGPGDHVVEAATRQLAVVLGRLGIEQHMALGLVGAALGDQVGDGLDHLLDEVGGLGLVRRAQGAERVHVFQIGLEKALGDDADLDAFIGGLLVDLVVDVGDVAGIDNLVLAIEMAQQTEQHIEDHHGPGIADMGVAVDRGTADIHRHPLVVGGFEGPLLAGHGVVQLEGHGLWCSFSGDSYAT